MTSVDSESEVLSFHELEEAVKANEEAALNYGIFIGLAATIVVEIIAYFFFGLTTNYDSIYGALRILAIYLVCGSFSIFLCDYLIRSRAERTHGEEYNLAKSRIAQRNAIQAEREAYLAKRREDYRRRQYSSYSSYPYSSSDGDDDDDSEDRRMCRKCHFRPVMGGRNYWRQSTCEQCLLEWDGDD